MRFDELSDGQKAFLEELDGMIESAGEFIRDDGLTFEHDPDGRFEDLAALEHVRGLFSAFYLDEGDPMYSAGDGR